MSDKKKKFGELKKLSMREGWSHEAHDFTPWLKDNISALGDALGLTLHAKDREVKIGKFYLDLLAVDDNGRNVAIENQFNPTDHSHLGQLLTYAAGCDAEILIWVTEYVQDEHRAAIEWLNRKTDTETEFYLVKVEVLQIDDSLPAYQFIPVVAANKWQKETHQIATVKTAEDVACGEYFHRFMEELKEREFPLESYRNHRDGTRYRWLYCGMRDWVLCHEFNGNYASIYLYFYKEDKAIATMLRDELIKQEESFKGKIGNCKWDEWGFSCVGIYRTGSFSDNENSLEEIRKWAVEMMFKFAEVFSKKMLEKLEGKVEKLEGKIVE